MYPPNTILERIEQITVDGQPDPRNKLRVVAVSPVKTASAAEWVGGTGEFLIVAPVDEFGPNEVIPESILNADYNVLEYGDEPAPRRIELDSPAHKRAQMRTPEQAFAEDAKAEQKKSRGRKAENVAT